MVAEFPRMSDCVKGEELAFAATFTHRPLRVVRIPSEELEALRSNEEVEPAAGCYDFEDAPEANINRFIIWRSNRSSLLVEERSVERFLEDASLCFCFSPANVIPGTHLCFAADQLIVIVATENALHRFAFDRGIQRKRGDQDEAIIKLADDQTFLYNHDCYQLTTVTASASRATIVHNTTTGTSALFSLSDGQIVLVRMHHAPGATGQGTEKIIRGEGLLQRVMKVTHYLSNVVSVASCAIRDNILFYVLFDDRRLHVYTNGKKEYDANLYQMIMSTSDSNDNEHVVAEMVKICSNRNSYYVVVLIQIADHCVFVLGKIDTYLMHQNAGYFSLINTFQAESGVVDFACALQENILDIVCLCRIPDGIRYCLRTTSIDCSTGTTLIPWKGVNEIHGGDPDVSALQAKPPQSIAAKKSYIFDPDRYSFGVVLRSLQLVCKKGAFNWELLEMRNNWQMLRETAEKYCSSVEFDQYYVTQEDRSLLATVPPSEAGQERFWAALAKMCNELMQNECLSLGLWHSVPLGLYGMVQQGRFTVCRPGDEQLRWFEHLIGNDQNNVNICWKIVSNFATRELVASKLTAEECEQFITAFSSVSHIFEDAIQKFTELRPVDEFALKTTPKAPFDGPFTTGLLATHFERLIDDRLALSQCFIALMELVKVIYSGENETIQLDARWEMTVSAHEKSLHDINRQFSILSQAMKLRVTIDRQNETSLANGFFASTGLPAILSYSQTKELFGEEDDMEDEDEDEEEEEIMKNAAEIGENIPRATPIKRPASAYSQFINKIIGDAVIVLWPENTAMVLARFLADKHQYSALQAFCQLNEPYLTELCSAYRFFEGFALAGLGEPEKALQSFMDALEGIRRGDEALNRMLSPDGNVPDEPYTDVQYVLKAMAVMELHGFHEQLVHLSRIALREALRTSYRYARALPGLYTSVFKFELITGRYEDALNTLLANPVSENRRICLRELLAKLIEKRKNAVIINLNYGNMEPQVIEILKANARTSDISKNGYFYELIYAFHVKREFLQRAALMLLEYSCRLQSELQNRNVLCRRTRALSIVASLLSLLPEADQFLALPAHLEKGKYPVEQIKTVEEQGQKEKRERKLGSYALFIWTLDDISKRALLSSARLALFDTNYNTKEKKAIPPPIKLEEIFEQLIQEKLFDRAWEVGKVFGLKPYPVLKAVTLECIRLDISTPKGEPRWVVRNRKFLKNIPSLRERHWAILRGYLEVGIRASPEDSRLLWTVTYILLQHQWPLPQWLMNCYQDRSPAEYAYLLIMFDHLQQACETLKNKVVSETKKVTSRDSHTSIPATEIDWLLWLINKRDDSALKEDAKQLKDYVDQYFERISSFSR